MTDFNTTFKDLLENSLLKETSASSVSNILESAKISHKELPISNLYAYFFNPKETHGLGRIFIESLIQLLNKSDLRFNHEKLIVKREVVVKEQENPTQKNYIDILITDFNNFIIIENKIHAHIYNDLNKYYQFINGEKINKVGVVLSINKTYNLDANFTEITHYQLISVIEEKLKQNSIRLDLAQQQNLDTFIQTIKSYYPDMENLSTKIKFFQDNEAKVEALNKHLDDLRRLFLSRIKQIGNNAFASVPFGIKPKNKDDSFSFYQEDTNLIGYVYTHAYNVSPLRVAIWIEDNRVWVKNWLINSTIRQTFEGLGFSQIESDLGKSWTLTIWKEYPVDAQNHEEAFETLALDLKENWARWYVQLAESLSK